MRSLLLLLALALAAPVAAQSADGGRYWIFFRDRGDAPAAPLSSEAQARRALRGTGETPAWAQSDVAPAYVAALQTLGVEPQVTSRWLNAVTAPLSAADRVAVAALPFVREVRPVARVERTDEGTPEPLPTPVLDFGASLAQLHFVGADATLEDGYDGTGVKLGFLDTQFNFDHPALTHVGAGGRLLGVQNFTGQSQSDFHGLATTSVAMGRAAGQLYGPANNASVFAATTEYAPTETHAEEDYFIAGLEWMEAQGVDVVSVSLGYSVFDAGEGDYTYSMLNGDTTPFTRAVDRAAALGVLMVVAAGNEGGGSWHYITAPADADSALAVGAASLDSTRASFSGVGPTFDGRTKPDVSALGVGVRLANNGGGYSSGNGTSFATPLVAAVACQVLQADPSLTPMEVIALMRQTASRAGTPDNLLGYGILDARGAIANALNSEPGPDEEWENRIVVSPTVLAVGGELRVRAQPGAEGYTVDVFDVYGRRVARLLEGTAGASGTFDRSVRLPNVPAGSYYVHLRAGEVRATQRIVVGL